MVAERGVDVDNAGIEFDELGGDSRCESRRTRRTPAVDGALQLVSGSAARSGETGRGVLHRATPNPSGKPTAYGCDDSDGVVAGQLECPAVRRRKGHNSRSAGWWRPRGPSPQNRSDPGRGSPHGHPPGDDRHAGRAPFRIVTRSVTVEYGQSGPSTGPPPLGVARLLLMAARPVDGLSSAGSVEVCRRSTALRDGRVFLPCRR